MNVAPTLGNWDPSSENDLKDLQTTKNNIP